MNGFSKIGSALMLVFVCQIVANFGTVYSSAKHSIKSNTTKLATKENSDDCQSVKQRFLELRIGHGSIVPEKKTHDPDMDICYKGKHDKTTKTCCSRRMERRYTVTVEKDFHQIVRSTSSYLKNLILTSTQHYQGEFRGMIEKAEKSTDSLLNTIYKIPKKDRHGPIQAMFMDIQAYVKRKPVNIRDSIDKFFDELFPLVFHNNLNDPKLTGSGRYTEEYKECLIGVRQDIEPQPFGDIPNKIFHHLTKSLSTSRTLIEALNLGVEAINTTDHMALENQCGRSLTKLNYCSHCQGIFEIKPCRTYCQNVMRGCMSLVYQLGEPWNDFVDAVKKLTMSIKGLYSLEEVLSRLDNTISDGIMHAMTNGPKFYPQVIAKCGHPKISKHTDDTPPPVEPVTNPKQPVKRVSLHEQFKSFIKQLQNSKGFYHTLGDSMCESDYFNVKQDERCWNGESVANYTKALIAPDIGSQTKKNPEMRVTQMKGLAILNLKDKLVHITKQIHAKLVTTDERMQGDSYASYNVHHQSKVAGSGDGSIGDDEDILNDGSGIYPFDGSGGTKSDDVYFPTSSQTPYQFAGSQPSSASSVVLSACFVAMTMFSIASWVNG